MGRNSEGEGGRHTWDGTVNGEGGRHTWDGTVKGKGEDIHGTEQGRGKTYMGRNDEGEDIHGTE